jgi:hypothetical protein
VTGAFPSLIGLQPKLLHRPDPEGSRGLLHPPIEAGQPGAAAVQRHRQMQGITRPQAEG